MLSLALLLYWRHQVMTSDVLPPAGERHGIAALFYNVVWKGPSMGEWATALGSNMRLGYSWPVLLLALIGMFPLSRRSPTLFLALLLAGLDVVAYRNYALNHTQNYSYLAPLVGAALGMFFVSWPKRIPAWLSPACMVVLIASLAIMSFQLAQKVATPFFRDMGHALTQGTKGEHGKRYLVAVGTSIYGYYVDSHLVGQEPILDTSYIQANLPSIKPEQGFRYLWLKQAKTSPMRMYSPAQEKAMAEFLAPFPRERLPQLEKKVNLSHEGAKVHILEAWMVTVKEPEV